MLLLHLDWQSINDVTGLYVATGVKAAHLPKVKLETSVSSELATVKIIPKMAANMIFENFIFTSPEKNKNFIF